MDSKDHKDKDNDTTWVKNKNFLFPSEEKQSEKSGNKKKTENVHKSTGLNGMQNTDSQRCSSEILALDMIESVILKLKSQDPVDVSCISIIKDLCTICNSENTTTKKLKLNLIKMLVENLTSANSEEIKAIKKDLKFLYIPTELKSLIVHKVPFPENSISLCFEKMNLFFGHGKLKKNTNTFQDVAVIMKMHNKREEKLYDLARILVKLDHPGIPKLLTVTRDFGILVFERKHDFCLCDLFQKQSSVKFTTKQIFDILIQIAKIVNYLHSQKLLLRDIQLRYFFYSIKEHKVFLFDFEFSDDDEQIVALLEEVSYNISPETQQTKTFTTKSDVWAMGQLCLELFLLTSIENIFEKMITMKTFVAGIGIPKRPTRCPEALYSFITEKLLNLDADKRPEFNEIVTILTNMKTKC